MLSGILVLAANAWMQNPVGFRVGAKGLPIDVDPWAVFLNPAWPVMAVHSALSAYEAVGFAAAGAYAWLLWRGRVTARYATSGIAIAMAVASGAAFIQPVVGDLLAKRTHLHQPAKLAAMESQFTTERRAPLRIGGWPNVARRETRFALEIPGALSFLATGDPGATVAGLDQVAREDWPNVLVTHIAFQVMVGAGTLMAVVALWYWYARWKLRSDSAALLPRGLQWALIVCAPLGFLALEAGWVVTEAGRQPWVIYNVMRSADSVTPIRDVWGSLAFFSAIYVALLILLVAFLRTVARADDHAGRP